jgi:hypothetical protein
MSRIILDASQIQQLHSANGPVELCDPSGKVVGRYVPVPRPLSELSEWELVGPEISDEELERRLNSDEPCYTTAEVLEYLRKL